MNSVKVRSRYCIHFSLWNKIVHLMVVVSFQTLFAQEAPSRSIWEYIETTPYFTFLALLVERSGIDEDILQEGDTTNQLKTVFGPIDDAFLKLNEDLLENLLSDEEWLLHLENLLEYHIVGTPLNSNDLLDGNMVENFVDQVLTFSSSNNEIRVNEVANVIEKDILATNGFIHAIDKLAGPQWIDMTILDILEKGNSQFSSLKSISNQDGSSYVDLLSSAEPYTVFAPINVAVDMTDNRLRDDILGLHIVPGIFTSADLMGIREMRSSSGDILSVEIDFDMRAQKINGQIVRETNILANNGIIHLVDGLFMAQPDPDELEQCEFLLVLEETRGINFGVRCTCQVVGTRVDLICSERGTSTGLCVPRYGQCNEDQPCCSVPLRRCVSGQCRDASRPEKIKLGNDHGGAAGRLRQDRGRTDRTNLSP